MHSVGFLKRAVGCSPVSCSTRTAWTGTPGYASRDTKLWLQTIEFPPKLSIHSKLRRCGRASTTLLTLLHLFCGQTGICFQWLPFSIFYWQIFYLSTPWWRHIIYLLSNITAGSWALMYPLLIRLISSRYFTTYSPHCCDLLKHCLIKGTDRMYQLTSLLLPLKQSWFCPVWRAFMCFFIFSPFELRAFRFHQ